ncbi:hypothetical protein [Arthrobacter koreensis]|uniref:hypothetical protein n=1 Tax=Arthrobacter koreensis TaxID=199136 RepID=UPI0038258AE0
MEFTVPASDIPAITGDPARGVIRLVGERGGLSMIMTPAQSEGFIEAVIRIETEHGVLYLTPETTTVLREERDHS